MHSCTGFLFPVLPLTVCRRAAVRKCHMHALRYDSGSDGATAKPGSLYVVSTPIGNSADITYRAVSILSTVDIIAAEDTRRIGILLKNILPSLKRKSHLISCHDYNMRERTPLLISSLNSFKSVALVSDAGTPCISDPGQHLVSAAITANIPVVPVPGACAALSAIVCTGFPFKWFTFIGFLPRSGSARTAALERMQSVQGAVVLYEAPHRLIVTLQDLAFMEAPGRPICVGRELTKRWEEFQRFSTVNAAVTWYKTSDTPPRGEFCIVLGPAPQPKDISAPFEFADTNVDIKSMALALLTEGVPVKAIAKSISVVAKAPKKAVYGYVSELKTELVRVAGSGKA